MDLQSNLIESTNQKKSGVWKTSLLSLTLHGAALAAIIYVSATATQRVSAEQPIRAFITQGAAPPPPPPPPPPAASASQPRATPTTVVKPVTPQQRPTFVQPTEIPKELPKVELPVMSTTPDTSTEPAAEPATVVGEPGGVPGGVVGGEVGGVQGGTVGGEVGGQIGGEVGGVKGGVIGGVLGGEVGGTGTGAAETPAPPSGPLRVGGAVKAPVATSRIKPDYTDVARKARVTGVVIVEAIIDKQGNVDQARVLKGLPMGLSEEAVQAVRKWKFRPGTLNGQPVDTIFSLTVNFSLDGSSTSGE